MDKCLSLLEPRTFNKPAFAGVFCFAVAGITLTALLLPNEIKEESQFKCYDLAEELRNRCYDAYDGQYNKEFPLYGFVFLNFLLVLFVCLVYSQYVKQRVENLHSRNEENPSETTPLLRSGSPSRKLFTAYVVHLLVRVVSSAIFLVLQWIVMYPIKFPSTYTCTCSTAMDCDCVGTHANQNSTAISSSLSTTALSSSLLWARERRFCSQGTTAHHNCRNPQARIKTWCGIALFAVNSLFLVFSLVELTRLIYKAVKDKAFTADGKFWACHLMGNQSEIPPEVEKFVLSLKRRILNDTEYITPLAPGKIMNSIKLDDTFVDLIIQTDRKTEGFSNPDRDEVLGSYARPSEGSITLSSTELFEPKRDIQDPRIILAVGRAGIGKTCLVKKILRDWANGVLSTANQAVKCFVFLLQFRFLNFKNNITLKELLSRSDYSVDLTDKVFKHILKNPEKVLLVFDGLDEAKKLDDIETHHQYENSHMKGMPVGALFAKLVLRKLLDGATILTTTRSSALPGPVETFYEGLNRATLRVVEILGFTPDRVKEYVNNVAPENMQETIWNHIQFNPNLLSLCYIPVNCFIMCTYFMSILQDTKDPGTAEATAQSPPQLPMTLTEIYKGALKVFVLKHHRLYLDNKPKKEEFNPDSRFRPEVENTLHKLGMLAKKGLEEGRLIFDKRAIKEHKLTDQEVQDMVESGLLHHLPERNAQMYELEYCFIHLTFQEFLAAQIVNSQNPKTLDAFASSAVTNKNMQMVLRFMAGLLRCEESRDRVTSFFKPIIGSCTQLCKMPTFMGMFLPDCEVLLTLIHCLFELQSEKMAKDVASKFKADETLFPLALQVNDADCASLAFFFKHTEDNDVYLMGTNIGPAGCDELVKLLKSGNLIGLHIDFSKVGDKELKSISEALENKNCKLKFLRLQECEKITAVGAEYLSGSLKKEQCQLTNLDISGNQLTDDGARYIGDTLAKSKLKGLCIKKCGITAVGAEYLSGSLKKEQCQLTNLDISGNQLTDDGARYIGDTLAKSKLKGLCIKKCGITAVGAEYLSGSLKKEQCQLTDLDISGNQLTYDGAKCIVDAVAKSNLKYLCIKKCGITKVEAEHLNESLEGGQCQLLF